MVVAAGLSSVTPASGRAGRDGLCGDLLRPAHSCCAAWIAGDLVRASKHGTKSGTGARWHPDRETLELAAAGAARVLGEDHRATKALAKASITMAPADLWQARLAVKTLRLEQREAIAEAGES